MFGFFNKVINSPRNAVARKSDDMAAEKLPRGRKVLNVGGNSKKIPIPPQYDGWEHVLLDIDPKGNPDVVCDARDLTDLPGADYDSVYCSHNLEHYYRHDVEKVLAGFLHILRDDGFAYIRVPDMGALMQTVAQRDLDIDDFLYQSPAGPITVCDVIYGYGEEIETSGNDFYAHKTGFTQKSLRTILLNAGFSFVYIHVGNLEISAFAFKSQPSSYDADLFNLSDVLLAEPGPKLSTQAQLLNECAVHKKNGNEFLAQGRLEEAAECYRQSVAVNPDYAEGFLNLGFVLKEHQHYEDAERFLRRAVLINPGMEDAYYLLGVLSQERGNLAGAIENYKKTLELKPEFEIVYPALCHVLFLNGQIDDAKAVIQKGIALNPNVAELHGYLGNLYVSEKNLEKAVACYRRALLIQPDHALVYSNMGKAFIELGSVDEAIECYQKALFLDPADIHSESCLLFIQSFSAKCSPAQYLAEARLYGSKVLAQVKPYSRWSAHPLDRDIQLLRVGLVSGDLKNHPVGFFLESILAHLNPARVELVAYPTQLQEDDLTARIKPRFVAWNPIAGLSDEAAARKIHGDGIHILIDLAGHTTHNRLPVFAWKPAPVQVSWLGYFASTGVPGMNYLLADPVSVPESHREQFTEAVWYLPNTRLCFTPPTVTARLTTTPPPVAHNGFITFGCFQNVGKINDAVLALWGRILHALPQARLRLQNKQMDSQTARDNLLQRLTQVGIAQERVAIEGLLPREGYLAAHADVDIILDTFPYPGGTTTCEALWMGVPTLTLAGDTMLSRQGASLLTCAGLEEWIASDEEDYVALALALAADVNRLAQLRSGLREKVLASPLFDAPCFALHLEDALQGMWQQKMSGVFEHA
jgi:predicted O-linked N-acetylglucosamine transferase (SPINDLY family)